MAEKAPTTARAQRQRAVETGQRDRAVERLSRNANRGGNTPETTSRERQTRAKREVRR